jgi:uncharacterized protein
VPVFNNPELCMRCNAKCCRYFMLEIDTPTCKSDFENIRWYLCHHNSSIYAEKGNKWFLHIESACRFLNEDGRCGVYDKRPQICREHDPSECEYDSEYKPKLMFTNLDELDNYIYQRFSRDKKAKKEEIKVETASIS